MAAAAEGPARGPARGAPGAEAPGGAGGAAGGGAAIAPGAHVVLRDAEGWQKVFRADLASKVLRMGRYPTIPVEAVLVVPYGAALRRTNGGAWVRHRRAAEPAGAAGAGGDPPPQREAAAGEAGQVVETNQRLAQDSCAQALCPVDVEDLKRRCSGEAEVVALASHSATFSSKTKFAQEKYIKKKLQKHVMQVTVLRPTLMELCETYVQQSRSKVCGLRFDYLASLLCRADVRCGGRYLLLDCACGLVAAAMAQQLAGQGQVFRIFRGGCPDKALIELDIGGEERAVVQPLPLDVVQSSDPWATEWLQAPPAAAPDAASAPAAPEQVARLALRHAERAERARRRRAAVADLEARPVDGAVLVPGEDDGDLLADALDLALARLAPGGRLVAYGQQLQPLAARQGALRGSGSFVDVRLHQLLTREYQVLPQRTHPQMSAEARLCEGFVLSATKVIGDTLGDGGAAEPALPGGDAAGAAGDCRGPRRGTGRGDGWGGRKRQRT